MELVWDQIKYHADTVIWEKFRHQISDYSSYRIRGLVRDNFVLNIIIDQITDQVKEDHETSLLSS